MNKNLANHINFDIRQIVPPVVNNISNEDLTNNIHVDQYLEKAEEINQLNLGNAGNLSDDLSYILNVDDYNLRGIGYASVAGIHTYNGNYKKALVGLNQALNLKVSDDVQAYIFTEYANLLRLLKRNDEALAIFNRASELTKNENLKWRIHTYLGYTLKYIDSNKALKILSKSADYYLKNTNYIRYATVLRHIGLVYSSKSDYRKTKRYFNVVKNISQEYLLSSMDSEINIDFGWLNVEQGKYDEAREIFTKCLSQELLPYYKSLALQNSGVLEFRCENYNKAINYHLKSLKLNSEYEMLEMLFEDYLKIALSYEKLGNYNKANTYYKDGYKNLQNERKELGIMLMTGFRKSLLDNYIRFLDSQSVKINSGQHNETFQFTAGKTYKEILDVFQENLLKIHRRRHKTIDQLCKSLDISLRLYFVYQNRFGLSRLEMLETPNLNQHLSNYLFSLANLDWREAKNKFDDDLYRYLLAKHSYNKTKIAEILDVSNLTVIKKTANLN